MDRLDHQLILNTLRHVHREDYITKEATSLLMRELDSAVSHEVAALPVQHHNDRGQSNPSQLSPGAPCNIRRQSDNQNVVRALLQAVRSKCRQRGSSLSNLTSSSNKPHPLPLATTVESTNVPLVNGHADHRVDLSRTQSGSPNCGRKSRGKSKFLLDLRTPNRRATTPPSSQSESSSTKPTDSPTEISKSVCSAHEPAISPCHIVVCPSTSKQEPPNYESPELQDETEQAEPSPSSESFLQRRNRFCTSYRLKIVDLKNPVDACVLSNGSLAVADYDNGFVVLDRTGDVLHHVTVADNKNACGVAVRDGCLVVLAYKEGSWSINTFTHEFVLTDTVVCPEDTHIETWALRKIAVGGDSLLYLMASGEHKLTIWAYDFVSRIWRTLVTENCRRGPCNDFAVRFDAASKDVHFLLCDWKKAQLSLVAVTDAVELAAIQSIKMKRAKGQEWIIQGPKLACWDEDNDILLYDGSGKLFLFDGEKFKCKKIVADMGRGEVSALAVKKGWCYALCRYRLTIEAFLYKEITETCL